MLTAGRVRMETLHLDQVTGAQREAACAATANGRSTRMSSAAEPTRIAVRIVVSRIIRQVSIGNQGTSRVAYRAIYSP